MKTKVELKGGGEMEVKFQPVEPVTSDVLCRRAGLDLPQST